VLLRLRQIGRVREQQARRAQARLRLVGGHRRQLQARLQALDGLQRVALR
jgi:hypothetical protein